MRLLEGLLLVLAVFWLEHELRKHRPSPADYQRLVENPDCAPFLDEHWMRRRA